MADAILSDVEEVCRSLNDPGKRRQTLLYLADWMIRTCLLFGCEVHTAYVVAAEFVKGIESATEKK